MGRIVELCGAIAEVAEEGADGLRLPPEDWERLSSDFTEDEIEDALTLVRESLFQGELVEAADSVNGRLLELLGTFGSESAYARAEAGDARWSIEDMAQLARRVDRLEEVLGLFRDDPPPDRKGFDALRRRLMDRGIAGEMIREDDDDPRERFEPDESEDEE